MAPGDVCHGPRCSLAGLGPVVLEYRYCYWLAGSAGSPQCVRPMGRWFFPVPRPPYVCAVSWAAWLLFTGVPARFAVLRLRCPGPLGSCSPVCSLGVSCCVCGGLGHLAPVHRCACSVCCFACAVSWATCLLFTGVPARCVVLRAVSSSAFPLLLSFCLLVLLFFFFFLGAAGLRRFWCCAWVWVCAGAGAGVGLGVVGDGGRVPAALWVPCVCAGPQASGFQGVGPGGADGGWLAAVVTWRLRRWSRLLGSASVAWPGAGACGFVHGVG